MEYKKAGAGYMVKEGNRTLTRANPGWGGAMGTVDHPWGVEWRYFPSFEEALGDADFAPLAAWGEGVWKRSIPTGTGQS
jgi:hypothetical protein